MKFLIGLLLTLLTIGQNPGPSVTGATVAPASCVAPTGLVYRWTPTAGCSTSTVCATDQVAGNNASQTTSADLPTYSSTGGPNNTPSLTFNGTTDYIIPTIPIAGSTTGLIIYAVFNQTANPGNTALIGGATSGLEYGVNGSGNMFLNQQSIQGIGAGSSTISLSTWYAKAITYNNTSNVWTFYNISGGSATSDGAGSTGYPVWAATPNLGGAANVGQNFHGSVAEWGYGITSTLPSGLATWIHCTDNI
jgi:hypothetical protein